MFHSQQVRDAPGTFGEAGGLRRLAAVDLICFPVYSAERFIDQGGHMGLTFKELEGVRLGETRGF